jgi:protein-tyrosine phosphatase
VYRSGELSRLTSADYARLADLGIAVICDFRRDSERASAPTAWQGARPPVILNLPGSQTERRTTASADGAAASATAAAPAATPPGLSPLLYTSYPTYVATLSSSFRTVIRQILEQDGAVLYHCTAGKDRTGSFSAVLLTLLGVPRDVVFEDYLLTNTYLMTPARVEAVLARGGTRESAATALGVDRTYLELFLTSIDSTYGSFDEYRRTGLRLSDADVQGLKAKLLE